MDLKSFGAYTGVLEFFSIFLPGAVLSLMAYFIGKAEVDDLFSIDKEFLTFYFGLAFFVVSYVFGHIVFQLGSFLDDPIYDKVKGVYGYDKNWAYVQKLREEKLNNKPVWAKELYDKAVDEEKIKSLVPPKEPDQFWHLDNFTWSTLYLLEHNPKLHDEVERLMADSKFFRGLFIVSVISVIAYLAINKTKVSNPMIWVTIGSLALVSMFFYIHVRQKSTKKAYKYVVYMHELRIPPTKNTTS